MRTLRLVFTGNCSSAWVESAEFQSQDLALNNVQSVLVFVSI